jgi:hypothetical protein
MNGYVLVLTLVNLALADAIVWFTPGVAVAPRRRMSNGHLYVKHRR